jgi:hypothetical protein
LIGSGFETTMDIRDAETLDLMLFEVTKLLYGNTSEPRHAQPEEEEEMMTEGIMFGMLVPLGSD